MRSVRWLVALCLAVFAAAALADTAGQVMFAYGETHALRQGRILVLHAGSPVESGDQLHTGVDSYLQVRFTDWGVMSLRPRTDFVIDEYEYEQREGGLQRAFFSLLGGGVRSLTGLIGHRDHSHYRLRTMMTSIGIRGTHYSVLICNQDCRLDDGRLGEDGVYGGVLEGRIAVSPYGGPQLEREFAAGEYFRLASANSVPEPFFAPPPFFWDKREPQARAAGKTFAGIPWKPSPGAAPAASDSTGAVASGDATGVAGSLLRTNGSLTLSPITAPVLSQVVTPVLAQTGTQLGSAVGALTAPLAPVVGSAANTLSPVTAMLGSTTSSLVNPVLAPVAPVLGSAVGSVVNPVAPLAPVLGSAVGSVVNPVAPIAPVLGSTVGAAVNPVIAPVAPVVGAVNPVVSPVVAPVASIATPAIAPVAPVVTPIVAPVAPVVTPIVAPVAPVVTPIVTAPPPSVSLPAVPTLPVVGGLPSLLPKK